MDTSYHIPISKKKYINISIKYDQLLPGRVDKIVLGTTGEGYKFIRVVVCQTRRPIVGDKFAFRHGQKGTVGILRRRVDLPFDERGISPDILMNSLAYPSRMTIALIIETVTGKIVSSASPLHEVRITELQQALLPSSREETDYDDLVVEDEMDVSLGSKKPSPLSSPTTSGRWEPDWSDDAPISGTPSTEFRNMFSHPNHPHLVDATPFRNFSIDVIREEIKKYGLEFGDQVFTDGITGKPLRCLVFFGPAFSQRLKHMVIDKVHARARGPRTTLARQPKEGRSLGGGLRVGQHRPKCDPKIRNIRKQRSC